VQQQHQHQQTDTPYDQRQAAGTYSYNGFGAEIKTCAIIDII